MQTDGTIHVSSLASIHSVYQIQSMKNPVRIDAVCMDQRQSNCRNV